MKYLAPYNSKPIKIPIIKKNNKDKINWNIKLLM